MYLESFREAEEEAEKANQATQAARERLDRANVAFHAWKTIIEQMQIGRPAELGQSPAQTGRSPTANGMPERTSGDEHVSKAEFVRRVLSAAGESGLTAGEIKAKAAKAGIEAVPGFPYTVLHRLKGQRTIRATGEGRYAMSPKSN